MEARGGCGNIQKYRAATHSNSAVGKGLKNFQCVDGHFAKPKSNSIVRVPDINTYFALGRHMFAQSL